MGDCFFRLAIFVLLSLPISKKILKLSRILAIDYGKKRTGLAVTDPLQLIANGLTTVETPQLMAYLRRYVEQEPVERIVVGLPMQPNGQPSENLPRVEKFVAKLSAALPDIPIDYYDERFTSVLAQQAIRQTGIGRRRRETDKGLVDEVSACIILQSWMESRKML